MIKNTNNNVPLACFAVALLWLALTGLNIVAMMSYFADRLQQVHPHTFAAIGESVTIWDVASET